MKTYSRVYEKIDLDAIAYNIIQLKNHLTSDSQMILVIKADGYGHGAVQIAEMCEDLDYIWGFAVATLDEAVVLRTEGIVKKPILVLGCVFPDQYMEMLRYDIRMNVYTEEMAESISHLAARIGKTAYMHIKLDTGMGRLGFDITEESLDAITRIRDMKNVCMEGIFTHFAKADEVDKTFTYLQVERFQWMVNQLEQRQISFEYVHCSNSAAMIDLPDLNCDLVRAGIAIYGLYPSEDVNKDNVRLRPAMSLKSHVAFVKDVEAGTPVSYGGTYVTEKKRKIATIPVGYADGYPRSLSGKGYVLIRGKKAPIIGRICMDQFMVDVTDIEGVGFGDKVTLIGRDGNETISVECLGDLSGRFNYEFICDLGKRIPRVYVKNGQIADQVDYFA